MKITYQKTIVLLSLVCVMNLSVWSTPIPIADAVSILGDGINSHWVNTSFSPHSVDQAIAALTLESGDAGYINEVNMVADYIDFADNYGPDRQGHVSGYTMNPLGTDESFAVEYSGYLNIVNSGTYDFRSYTDDGFRLIIGDEIITQYYNDRAAGTSYGSAYFESGLYEISMISWEQGGAFVNELSWGQGGAYSLLNKDVLFTTNPTSVPEPGVVSLLFMGFLSLGYYIKRKK